MEFCQEIQEEKTNVIKIIENNDELSLVSFIDAKFDEQPDFTRILMSPMHIVLQSNK